MNTLLALALLPVALQCRADQGAAVPVQSVSEASIQAPFNSDKAVLKVGYATGGCKKEEHATEFGLRLDRIEDIASPQSPVREYNVHVTVEITQKRAGNCAMAYFATAEVDLRRLAVDYAPRMGINLNEVRVAYHFIYSVPPVQAQSYFMKWK